MVATLAVLINIQVRNTQYQAWNELYGNSGSLLFSTTDAPYFLGLAGALKRGETVTDYETLLAYPDNLRNAEEDPDAFSEKSPALLSTLLEHFAPSARPIDLLTSVHRFVLICAGTTTGLIILAFVATGCWLDTCKGRHDPTPPQLHT